jgi:nitrate reductase delta subunit
MSLWADSASDGRLGPARKGAGHLDAVERLKDWTRARFALTELDTVMVTEEKPSYPGCPPMETVVAFWIGGRTPHHFRVFKGAREVTEADIPPGWMRDSLVGIPGITCSCC